MAEKTPVKMCYCGGWPHLEWRKGKCRIVCANGCGVRGEWEEDIDAAIGQWNKEVEEIRGIVGGFGL